MPHLARFILIDAPLAAAFAIVSDYRNIPRLQPQFDRVRLVSTQEMGVGAEIELHGSFRGLPITSRTRIVAFDPPNLLVSDSHGQVRSRATWRFTPAPAHAEGAERTRASLALDYEVDLPGLGWLVGGLVGRDVEAMTVESLRRLKQMVEQPDVAL